MNESSIYSVRPSSSRDVTQIETRTLRNRFTPTIKPISISQFHRILNIGHFKVYCLEKGKAHSKKIFPVNSWRKPRGFGK